MDSETEKYILAALVEPNAQKVWRSRVTKIEKEEGISFSEAANKTPLVEEDVITAFKSISFCKEVLEKHLADKK